MMVFCTLFDSNYLDKGIVMYRSLAATGCDFKMYVLAMDAKCKEILESFCFPDVTVIALEEFILQEGLSDIRANRPRSEFCWTCTPYLISYVLEKCGEEICTYVDSDLYFYSNPQCLIDEMGEKTVQIVEHRFNETVAGKLSHAKSGTYCVEFNTFKNTPEAIALLHWWKDRCGESCSIRDRRIGVYGDQGYLENWGKKPEVSVLQNLGGGVAPWNVAQYRLLSGRETDAVPILEKKKTKEPFTLVFYHFHYISYYEAHKVSIHVYGKTPLDDTLITRLYMPYLKELDKAKNEIRERFGFYPLLTAHPGFEERSEKKGIRERLRSIDRLFFLKLYAKTVGRIGADRYAYKNTIVIPDGEETKIQKDL